MSRIITTLLIALVALGPGYVFAQEARPELTQAQQERVVQLISSAKKAYNEGRFEDALKSFQAAYDLFPHPDVLYRMALCYERLGEDQQAVAYYKKFLDQVPEAPERPRIEKTIQVIESRISKSEIRVVTDPEGAVVYIDDVANGPAGYSPTELPVKPGAYRVIVKKEGYESVEELVEVASGQTVALRYQLKSVVEGSKVSGAGTTGATGVSDTTEPFDATWVILMAVGIGALTASVLFYQPYKASADQLDDWERDRQSVRRDLVESEENQKNLYLGLTIGTAALGVGLLIWSWIAYENSVSRRAEAPEADDGLRFGVGPTGDGEGAQIGLGLSW